ncbi:uncharacterized protein LOC129302618 [Prosopis cineraria]|uniref:uncharacterized protein LOC129302618 n=1 Tax=Prosopis cineraria TaxID=364024 RepID=UPI00240FA53D|nr:uncharacterized protein LOC129302618 [Prosopis cineraria]
MDLLLPKMAFVNQILLKKKLELGMVGVVPYAIGGTKPPAQVSGNEGENVVSPLCKWWRRRDTIHNHPLLPNYVRVSILVTINPNYPLLIPTDEAQMVGKAIIAWPSRLVIVVTLKPTKDPLPPKKKLRGKSKLKSKLGHNKESTIVSQYPAAPVPVVEYKYHVSLEIYAMATRMASQVAIGDIISFDDGLCGRSGLFEVVRNEILNKILKHKMVSTSLMGFYMSLESRFKLINTYDVSAYNGIIKEALEDQAQLLSDQFKDRGSCSLVSYCNQQTLSPNLRALDSYETWIAIKYPLQPDQSNDCGYYLIRFLKDIITHAFTTLPNKYFKDAYCV